MQEKFLKTHNRNSNAVILHFWPIMFIKRYAGVLSTNNRKIGEIQMQSNPMRRAFILGKQIRIN